MGTVEGKIALVTGAARGIGRAIAAKLASEGAHVGICDLSDEWLQDTTADVAAAGRRALRVVADVSKPEDAALAVDRVVSEFGRLDILVNNAGITRDGLIVRMSEADWDAVIAVNLRGAFLFTKSAAKAMLRQRGGSIVNIASIIGLIGNAGQCNYAAAKAGLIALTKSAAKELASRGIRVNAVAPGFIETKMTESLSETARAKMLEAIPLGRLGTPADVAEAVLFLASDAASYVTGQVLNVSGGMVM